MYTIIFFTFEYTKKRSEDIEKRLILHNSSKGAKFTKGNYWKIIYQKKWEEMLPCLYL